MYRQMILQETILMSNSNTSSSSNNSDMKTLRFDYYSLQLLSAEIKGIIYSYKNLLLLYDLYYVFIRYYT